MKEICQEALAVQDACNLSGVVHSFSRSISDLRSLLLKENDFSTSMLNQHPVCILYSSKIASLTGSEINSSEVGGNAFSEAYAFCQSETLSHITESDDAYRNRICALLPQGAVYTAEEIGEACGEKLDAIGLRFNCRRVS
jgi:hypothetical protein